jgi:hypothetical protein
MDATSFSWLATGYSKFDPVFVKPCRQFIHKTLRTDRSLSASTQTTAVEDLSHMLSLEHKKYCVLSPMAIGAQ